MPGPVALNDPGPLLGGYEDIDRARGLLRRDAVASAARELNTKLLNSTVIEPPQPPMDAPATDVASAQPAILSDTKLPGVERKPVQGTPVFNSPEEFARTQREASTLADTTPLGDFTPYRPGFKADTTLKTAPVPSADDDWKLLSGGTVTPKPQRRIPSTEPPSVLASLEPSAVRSNTSNQRATNASFNPPPIADQGGGLRHSYNIALSNIIRREGFRTTVYEDSLGNPTVGVGHLVKPEDGLRVGDSITKEQARDHLERDARSAYRASQQQMAEARITDPGMLEALTAVNFQLGPGWTKTFSNSWALIKEGRYNEAASRLRESDWYKQTPERVRDFQSALNRLANASRQARR